MIDLHIGDTRQVLKASIIKLGINNRINMAVIGASELETALDIWFKGFTILGCFSFIDEIDLI